MKKLLIALSIITSILFISCASNEAENYDSDYDYDYSDDVSEPVINIEITDDFIGDYDPVEMGQLVVLYKYKNDVKPKQIKNVYLVPRTNTIELSFRDGVNGISIIWNKAERDKIFEACNTFLAQYEEKTIPHHKVSSKNAYIKSKCPLYFGVASKNFECKKNDYYVNVEFIQKRPYLLIHFTPSRCENQDDGFTPAISFYMSPTQVRDFLEEFKQENLNSLLDDLNEKAYTY